MDPKQLLKWFDSQEIFGIMEHRNRFIDWTNRLDKRVRKAINDGDPQPITRVFMLGKEPLVRVTWSLAAGWNMALGRDDVLKSTGEPTVRKASILYPDLDPGDQVVAEAIREDIVEAITAVLDLTTDTVIVEATKKVALPWFQARDKRGDVIVGRWYRKDLGGHIVASGASKHKYTIDSDLIKQGFTLLNRE